MAPVVTIDYGSACSDPSDTESDTGHTGSQTSLYECLNSLPLLSTTTQKKKKMFLNGAYLSRQEEQQHTYQSCHQSSCLDQFCLDAIKFGLDVIYTEPCKTASHQTSSDLTVTLTTSTTLSGSLAVPS